MALVGIISDVHATVAPVSEAMTLFKNAGVSQILCAGDIAGYMTQLDETINLLRHYECRTVVGNHDLSYLKNIDSDSENASFSYLKSLPVSYQVRIEGKSLYMVHAQPPDGNHGGIKLLDKNGQLNPERVEYWSNILKSFEYDILVIGHTHQVFAEYLADTLVINPGSSVFNNSCALLRLPEMTVEMLPLSGKKIEHTWNWADHVIYAR